MALGSEDLEPRFRRFRQCGRPNDVGDDRASQRHRRAQVSTGALPSPLRHFMAELDERSSGEALDMDQAGRLLVELATNEEFFAPLIDQIPAGSPGVHWLVQPERGPRLVLVHRPEGVMAYTHSHHCWVALAPVRGVGGVLTV